MKIDKKDIISRFGEPDYQSKGGNLYYFKPMIQVKKVQSWGRGNEYVVVFMKYDKGIIKTYNGSKDEWVTLAFQERLVKALNDYIVDDILLGD